MKTGYDDYMAIQPKVSILIPVYNTARYLPKCMASVLNQTLKEIEVIAVNDASPDDAAEVLAEYAARDARVKVITHEKNGGILAARLSGIAAASGEYLIFLDADDFLDVDTARACYRKAKKTGADMIHFCFDVRMGHKKKSHFARKVEQRINPYRGVLRGREVFEGAFVHYLYSWNICGKFISAEICRKAAKALPPGYYIMAEDFCFYTMMSWFAAHYEPLFKKCYHYGLEIGVSAYSMSDYSGFLRSCTVFTALNAVKSFLTAQGVFEQYRSAFEEQELRILSELVERWEGKLIRYDRVRALTYMFENYSPRGLLRAFICRFAGREDVLAGLLGEPEIFRRRNEAAQVKHAGLYVETPVTGAEFVRMLTGCAGGWQKAGIQITVIAPEEDLLKLPPGMNRISIPAGLSDASADSFCSRVDFWNDLREKYGIDTVVHGAAELPSVLFDALSIRLAGLKFMAAPLAGCHSLADSSLGQFLAKMRAFQLADALAVQTDRDKAFFQAFQIRCCKIAWPVPGLEAGGKTAGKKQLLWLGHLGDPEAEIMAAAWAKITREFPDYRLCMVGRTPGGVSERTILTLAEMLKIGDSLTVRRNPDAFTEQLRESSCFVTTSEDMEGSFSTDAAKAAGVPCFHFVSRSPEQLAEELTGILNGTRTGLCLSGPAADCGMALFRPEADVPAKSDFPAGEFLQILNSYQLKFEPYVLLPAKKGASLIPLYRQLDAWVYRLLPAESPRRDWFYRACRWVLNRIKRKG